MRRLPLGLFVILFFAAPLHGDSLKLTSGLVYDPVHIERIESGRLSFRIASSDDELRDKPLSEVATFTLDDEPDFDAGEAAFQKKDYAAATDAYARSLGATKREWLKDFIAPRLLAASTKTHRFDAEVRAWLRMNARDTEGAAPLRPAVPEADDPKLTAAAQELEDAARTASGPARRSVLALLLDVQTARQDSAAATSVARALENDQPPAADAGAAGPAEIAEQDALLVTARADLAGRKFDMVVTEIDAAAPRFTEPVHQADALFLKAQALDAMAAANGGNDAWKDAALAYLRVDVHFPDGRASLHSAQALLKAAQIEQNRMHEPAAALILYRKLMSDFSDSPEARRAAPAAGAISAGAPK